MISQTDLDAEEKPARPHLTERELQVIDLITQGFTNHIIGKKLGISRHTVKYHVNNVTEKLGDKNRVRAAVLAVRLGIV